jgi:predicted ribosome quality control (RQC) complex YloA/Tae2 family protein
MKSETVFIQGLKREIVFHIGQNQTENFSVIDKGKGNDLWFHANDCSSCHVVGEVPEDINKKDMIYIIKAGGLLCKNNTNKLKSLKNVTITYACVKYVTKTDIPGMVITENTRKIFLKG